MNSYEDYIGAAAVYLAGFIVFGMLAIWRFFGFHWSCTFLAAVSAILAYSMMRNAKDLRS